MTGFVLGIDPSLTATATAGPTHERLIAPKKLRNAERLHHIEKAVVEEATGARLVVIEGYAHGAHLRAHQLGELGGVLRVALWRRRIPYLEVAPAKVKKFATGSGIADKALMVGAAQRLLGYEGCDHNVADAMWLRAVGCWLVGEPLVDGGLVEVSALDGVDLPEGVLDVD